MTPTIDAMRSDLPRATVRWRQEGLTQKNCDVLVDGQDELFADGNALPSRQRR